MLGAGRPTEEPEPLPLQRGQVNSRERDQDNTMGRIGRGHSVWGCAPQEALGETVRGGPGGGPSNVNC